MGRHWSKIAPIIVSCNILLEGGGGWGLLTKLERRNRDAIMISRCQGDDTFVAFQPMGIFRFWRNGEFTFVQRCLQPLYFCRSPSPTQSSLPFCAGVQFSRIEIRENRGL